MSHIRSMALAALLFFSFSSVDASPVRISEVNDILDQGNSIDNHPFAFETFTSETNPSSSWKVYYILDVGYGAGVIWDSHPIPLTSGYTCFEDQQRPQSDLYGILIHNGATELSEVEFDFVSVDMTSTPVPNRVMTIVDENAPLGTFGAVSTQAYGTNGAQEDPSEELSLQLFEIDQPGEIWLGPLESSCGSENVQPPLPVDLVRFEVEKAGANVRLTWATAYEEDNQKFEVQRSIEGRDWETIGEVAGAGDAASERSYSFVDFNWVFGQSYYRLKQIDYDGDYQYHVVRGIHVEGGQAQLEALRPIVYPTLAVHELNVTMPDNRKERDVAYIVVSLDGKSVKTGILPRNQQSQIDISDLSHGQYWISFDPSVYRDARGNRVSQAFQVSRL